MYEKNYVKRIVIGGLLLAIGVIIPYIFHSSAIPGNIFLPMHIPVLIGGFLLPPPMAALLGMLTPILNSLVSGMPKFPISAIMVFELGIYGLVASILYRRLNLPLFLSLIISMIAGRVMAGLTVFVLAAFFGMQQDPITFVKLATISGVPGIIIQLILVPILIHAITKYTTIDLD